jgi:hypothetical protein
MFTKELRQQIIQEFAVRHNGNFNPRLFFEEVKETGEDHAAHGWFQWDVEKGWLEHNLGLARDFAQGLKVSFSIEEVGSSGAVNVRSVDAPALLSPVHYRHQGGGYQLTDPSDANHMTELCRQAATALASWLKRYEAALVHAGGSPRNVQAQVRHLERQAEKTEAA